MTALVVMALTFGLSHGIEFRQKIPIKKSFKEFPMQVGEWSGARENMEQVYLDVLKFSDYIIVNYTNKENKAVNFYVAYYQDQRKGESIHSPETCLPGSGWIFRESGKATIAPGQGNPSYMQVNRALIEKGNFRQLSYYWFPIERQGAYSSLPDKDIQFLGRPYEAEDRWGARACHYDGLSIRADRGCREEAPGFRAEHDAGAG